MPDDPRRAPQPYVKGSYPTPAPTAPRPAGAGHLSAVLVADKGSAAAAHGKAPAAEPNPPVSSDRSTKVSYAIFELDIEAPPITIRRVRAGSESRWIAVCEVCGHRSRPRPLLSVAVKEEQRHGTCHAALMLRASTGSPANAHRLGKPGGQLRLSAPLDAVHIKEQAS